MSRRRFVAVTALLALAAVVAVGVWAQFFRPITVQVAHVEQDVPVEVFGLGTVEARVASKVGFKISGVLVDVSADVGDRLAKGAPLARLDNREQMARVARAKAAEEQSEANLQKATAALEKAQVNYANAKTINERRQALLQGNSTSIETAQAAQAAEDAAHADVDLAASEVLVANAAISDAKAQQQQEAATLDFHTLTAPYDAMVTERLKEPGSALAVGEPVFSLIDPRTVWVLAYIDESRAGEIAVGQAAEIVLRSQPDRRIAAHVARIEPESDRVNEERRVEIAFDHLSDDFHLGEQAEVYITTARLDRGLFIPEGAIEGLGENRGTVWTVEDGRLRHRAVTLRHRLLDGRYEITGGVPENTAVVSRLRSGLRDGRSAESAKGQVP
jgi:HlyD family secretion protein